MPPGFRRPGWPACNARMTTPLLQQPSPSCWCANLNSHRTTNSVWLGRAQQDSSSATEDSLETKTHYCSITPRRAPRQDGGDNRGLHRNFVPLFITRIKTTWRKGPSQYTGTPYSFAVQENNEAARSTQIDATHQSHVCLPPRPPDPPSVHGEASAQGGAAHEQQHSPRGLRAHGGRPLVGGPAHVSARRCIL